MEKPSERRSESEAQEIDREMELIQREGGGAAESAPLRRLAYLVVAVIVVVVALRLFGG